MSNIKSFPYRSKNHRDYLNIFPNSYQNTYEPALLNLLMQETTLIKLSLIIVFIGIPILSIITLTQENLNLPYQLHENEKITIQGKITQLSHTKATTRIMIAYETTLPAVIFDNIALPINATIRTTGKIKNKELLVEDLEHIP